MKTRLLKKTRKRFEIIHMPEGFTQFGYRYEYNLFLLKDSTNQFFEKWAQCGSKKGQQYCQEDTIFVTEKECIDHLKSEIIDRLRGEGHLGRRDNQMREVQRKVWYTY